MNVWQMVLREIKHRKLNFALMLSTVVIAIGSLVGAQVILRGGELKTQRILKDKQTQVSKSIEVHTQKVTAAGKALSDATRKEMLKLGFNLLIVPKTQDLQELGRTGIVTEEMPEKYVQTLANSSIVTVNHLLPSVTKHVEWPEQDNLKVILVGTRGEVPIHHRKLKKPLLAAVPPGTMVVGHQIQQKLKLKVGDTVKFQGREFTVNKLHPSRDLKDNSTIWIDLKEAQEILGMQNVIHAILALECECAGDRITQIRADIKKLLPETQVIERYSQAVTPAEMRSKVKVAAEASLAQATSAGEEQLVHESNLRVSIQSQERNIADTFVLVALIGAAALIAVLAITNVRNRRDEIGILRAIGFRSSHILLLFLSKAVGIGFLGGVLGCGLGLMVGISFTEQSGSTESLGQIFESTAVIMTLSLGPILAPVLAAVASWLPSTIAARQDPATVLQEA